MIKRIGLTLVAALIFFCATQPASAAKPAENVDAKQFITSLTDKVLAISSDKTKAEKAKEAALVSLMDQALDIDRIGKFVLGVHWRTATPEQRTRYTKAYHRYLVETYIPKLLKHSAAKVTIKRVLDDSQTDSTVETEVNPDGTAYIQVDYKLRKQQPGNAFRIIDVVAEGISLSSTHRADFASIIDQEGLDAFIARLEAKAAATR